MRRCCAPRKLAFSPTTRAPPTRPQVLFVSQDQTLDDFDEYFAVHPWAAVPFEADEREALSDGFKVEHVPKVIVLNAATGAVVHGHAADHILQSKSLVGLF